MLVLNGSASKLAVSRSYVVAIFQAFKFRQALQLDGEQVSTVVPKRVGAPANPGKNLAILREMGLSVHVVRILHVMHRYGASYV
jgi:hypothetical protein